MRGNNPIRPPVKGDGATLDVKNIFSTVQGEGPNTGCKAVFLRLGGCNLACSFCDTDFEQYASVSVAHIIEKINSLAGNEAKLVVITGGEPLRQPIEVICQKLLAAGYRVQVETNGTLYRPLPDAVEIVCSPKNTGSGYFAIRPDLLKRVTAFKFIISAGQMEYSQIAEIGQAQRKIPVYVQPMDEYDSVKNRRNMQYAIALAAQGGYRLSLQTHKVAGLE